jgi:hypothetical protein
MDRTIYRGIIALVCIMLAILLIVTPVLTKMYMATIECKRGK